MQKGLHGPNCLQKCRLCGWNGFLLPVDCLWLRFQQPEPTAAALPAAGAARWQRRVGCAAFLSLRSRLGQSQFLWSLSPETAAFGGYISASPQLGALSARVGIITNQLRASGLADSTALKPSGTAHSVYLCSLLRFVLSGFSSGSDFWVFSYANSILTPWSCNVI